MGSFPCVLRSSELITGAARGTSRELEALQGGSYPGPTGSPGGQTGLEFSEQHDNMQEVGWLLG